MKALFPESRLRNTVRLNVGFRLGAKTTLDASIEMTKAR
jgi:hypothetical protein